MSNFLEEFLKSRNLSEDQIEFFSNQFSGIVLMTILGHTLNRITRTEEELLADGFRSNNTEQLWDFLRKKYSSEEWANLFKQEVDPLIDNYLKEVLLCN